MATPAKKQKIGQPEIMVAQTSIGRDSVVIAFPKAILSQMNLANGDTFFCITNGVAQVSGQIPNAVMPPMILDEDAFVPQQ